MAEATPASTANAPQEAPKQVCEKCRNSYTLDHFQHGVAGQECVCRRCLAVMGYKVG
ncbi:MAG: hypothetical protein P4L36_11450 [Holophaga sp.]|nr:hypothetical protein [Holophaga sp.]